ncbi:MAG TPA: trehalose-6-phosphate synthase, partial [Zeimonas sp.]
LVAKEYVAAQGLNGGSGVLVLSEFAGAAAELHGAVLTNPHDPNDLVAKLHHAITMPRAEAQSRLRTLFGIVQHDDIHRWGEEFLASVRESVDAARTGEQVSDRLSETPSRALLSAA